MKILEIAAFSLESCITAQANGATRIELCNGIYEGGTTPSAGLIRLARQILKIPLFAMIRPRGGDFLYDSIEFQWMKEEIKIAKDLGVDGFVLGILKANGNIDIARTTAMIELAYPIPVTFHRAFDMSNEPLDALEDVIQTGAKFLLTSGQKNIAIEGKNLIEKLVQQAQGRISILAGSGVNAHNAKELLDIGVQGLHLSAKSKRKSDMNFHNTAIEMGGQSEVSEFDIWYADKSKIRAVAEIIH